MKAISYFVIPNTADGCDMPTRPEPVELPELGAHIAQWLSRYEHQGYYSNCKQQRIPLDAISFRIEPMDSHGYVGVIEL